jgi:cholesterol transport system auxiliary component
VRRRLCCLAITSLALPACSLVPQGAADEPTLHLLDVRATVAPAARRDLVLALGAPRSAAGYESAAMLYLQRAHALERYATHRWADAPARLLRPLLLRALDDGAAFRAVVTVDSGAPAALRLDTELLRLQQSFLVRPSRVELVLRAQLVDTVSRRVLATRSFEVNESAPTEDAAGGVVAANAAVAALLAQLTPWCAEAARAAGAERGEGHAPLPSRR